MKCCSRVRVICSEILELKFVLKTIQTRDRMEGNGGHLTLPSPAPIFLIKVTPLPALAPQFLNTVLRLQLPHSTFLKSGSSTKIFNSNPSGSDLEKIDQRDFPPTIFAPDLHSHLYHFIMINTLSKSRLKRKINSKIRREEF